MDLEKLKYPIGQFEMPARLNDQTLREWMEAIRDFPHLLRSAVDSISDSDLSLLHRPGGWTIRQLVHHCADSHMNGLIRQKLALSEDNPTIKPYNEAVWALQADETMAVGVSLTLLESVHARWYKLLNSLSPKQFDRTYFHPAADRKFTISESVGSYAWHGRHHLAHISQALATSY